MVLGNSGVDLATEECGGRGRQESIQKDSRILALGT